MSFGWSAGDIISGVTFLIKVFKAVDSRKGGKALYFDLVQELQSLQKAFDAVKGLEPEGSLDEATESCRRCINTFVERIKKFKGLEQDQSLSKWSLEMFMRNVRAVEWAMWKKEEVDNFRKAVLFHTAAILSLQISLLSLESRETAKRQIQGQDRLIGTLESQASSLRDAESQLQRVIDHQKQLLGDVRAASEAQLQLGLRTESEIHDISQVQAQSKEVLDAINQTVENIDSRMRSLDDGMITPALLSKNKFDQLASRCLQALFVTDPLVDRKEIETRKDNLLEGSCDWILPQVDHFLESNDACRLWIHGSPGKGKTMIAMALLENLQTKVEANYDTMLSFFFCDSTSNTRNSLLNVLKTILRQVLDEVLKTQPGLTDDFLQTFENTGEAMFSSVEAVWMHLNSILLSASFSIAYFIIDALDECDEQSLDTFLYLSDEVVPPNLEAPVRKSCQIKWILLSRNESLIADHLKSSKFTTNIDLEENSSQIRQSVDRFIEAKVKELAEMKRYDAKLSDLVQSKLGEKAENTFLWVSLACRELRKPKVRTINTRLALEKLPSGLFQIYDRIHQQILENEFPEIVQYVKEILRSVVLAIRPLSLGELAVVAGLPISGDQEVQEVEEYIEQCGSILVLQKKTVESEDNPPASLSSSPLVSLGDPSLHPSKCCNQETTVHFIHQSAKDYLLSIQQADLFSPTLSLEHEMIMQRCLRYIEAFNPRPSGAHDKNYDHSHALFRLTRTFKTGLEYPLRYWIEHGNFAFASSTPTISDISCTLFSRRNSILMRAWIYTFGPWYTAYDRAIHNQVPVQHFAAFQGMIWILEVLFQSRQKAAIEKVFAQDGSTPLMWAIEAADLETVRWLLEKGVSPNAHRKLGDPPIWPALDTSLSLAAKKNRKIFELLLSYGADVHLKCFGGHTSLSLLVTEPKLNLLYSPQVRGARFRPDLTAVATMLEHGANPTTPLPGGETPLHWVAQSGNLELMELLLSHGTDSNICDSEGQSPLHWAVCTQDSSMASLLVRYGASTSMTNIEGHSAMDLANRNGSEVVAKALLQKDGGSSPEPISQPPPQTSAPPAPPLGPTLYIPNPEP